LNYITGEKKPPTDYLVAPTGCIFCDKPREEADAGNGIVVRGETCYVILNAFPYNNGHLMVVPYRHLAHPAELTDAENAELMQTASRLTGYLDTIYRPDGYNIGMNVGFAAGAGIAAHLHLHLVPRWNGDTNFMTAIGETRILPEMLQNTYDRLRAAIAAAERANGEDRLDAGDNG
jgi:ATP adenylyltransferase